MSGRAVRPFTGRHMTLIMFGFFGVVIAVNMVMAGLASSSFTGVVVENSYVASQRFNGWLDEARAERQLGWSATARREADGHVLVSLVGVPAGAKVVANAWHPLGRSADHELRFVAGPDGFRSDRALPAGRWRIRIEVTADGRRWRTEEALS